MAPQALSIYMGASAARHIAREGWQADLFKVLIGASGGPKWFVLSQLDRLLFGDFLQRSNQALSTIGSSIGSWRNICLALPDPAAAITRLEQGYLHQHFSLRPDTDEISRSSKSIIKQMLGPNGAAAAVANHRINSHIVTARGRGPAGSRKPAVLGPSMALAALANTAHRRLLASAFQRSVFHSHDKPDRALHLPGFDTCYSRLSADNLSAVLHASGAIPFVLTGERNITGAAPGQYWDGGIIDYHFNLQEIGGDGLILYPHFRASITPGWFDKFLPWRSPPLIRQTTERLVLLCPSDDFIAKLPYSKIPDRQDFTQLSEDERIACWQCCIQRSMALAEEFHTLLNNTNPLAGVTILSQSPGKLPV
ncbi:MAG: patatin-like phospholipase family protein [Parahaliea sp.]